MPAAVQRQPAGIGTDGRGTSGRFAASTRASRRAAHGVDAGPDQRGRTRTGSALL